MKLFKDDFWTLEKVGDVKDIASVLSRMNENILLKSPFMVDFHDRARIFNLMIRKSNSGHNNFPGFNNGQIEISRSNIYEDAYHKIGMLEDFKGNYTI